MCGIAGVVLKNRRVTPELVQAMSSAMVHRGPDSSGVWLELSSGVGLGHQRLAILDLSDAGHQPMVDAGSGCVVVFNGEIYNFQELRVSLGARGHQFRGHSDTEVILAAYKEWGTKCPEHFNGMFAFSIWDPRNRCLFAARDRAGEKPYFYVHDGSGFRFASELKGLMADSEFERRVDREALRQFLLLGYVPAPLSIFVSTRKLCAGHALLYSLANNELATWSYWEIPASRVSGGETGAFDPVERVQQLETLLSDSVRRQMVADVPVGILLSGGLDSSLVTAFAARFSSAPVKTFTMTFPGHGRFDEARHAASIARHFGTEHHELEAKPASLGLLPQLAEQFDEPMVDSSMIPTFLVTQMIRRHAKVALGGDGGDELFGGYSTYARLELLARLNRLLAIPAGAKRALVRGILAHYGKRLRGRNYLAAFGDLASGRIPEVRRFLFSAEIAGLLRPDYARAEGSEVLDEPTTEGLYSSGETMIYRLCRADVRGYLAHDILTKVDRASMLNSLEVRAPWLDQHVMEFAFAEVPDALKTKGERRKVLPKMLARRLFPADYDFDRKQGFSLPLSGWFRNEGGGGLSTMIRENSLPIFQDGAVSRWLGTNPGPEKVFGLALLGLWARIYKVAF